MLVTCTQLEDLTERFFDIFTDVASDDGRIRNFQREDENLAEICKPPRPTAIGVSRGKLRTFSMEFKSLMYCCSFKTTSRMSLGVRVND